MKEPEEWWSGAIQAIGYLADSMTLHPGEIGEEYFQILLNVSMDMALRDRTQLANAVCPEHLMLVNAMVFLREMFGPNA
jgi:hypothetical protein